MNSHKLNYLPELWLDSFLETYNDAPFNRKIYLDIPYALNNNFQN